MLKGTFHLQLLSETVPSGDGLWLNLPCSEWWCSLPLCGMITSWSIFVPHFQKHFYFLQIWYLHTIRLDTIYGCIFFHTWFHIFIVPLVRSLPCAVSHSSLLLCACIFFRHCGLVTPSKKYYLVSASALGISLSSDLTILSYLDCFW